LTIEQFRFAFANAISAEEGGALLVIDGDRDNTVPPRLAKAAYARHKRNANVTEYLSVAGRGHSLIIDSGWRDVAEATLAFLRRFV
jgi:pimeloyl-ACP methyl ester carboxylesterase